MCVFILTGCDTMSLFSHRSKLTFHWTVPCFQPHRYSILLMELVAMVMIIDGHSRKGGCHGIARVVVSCVAIVRGVQEIVLLVHSKSKCGYWVGG